MLLHQSGTRSQRTKGFKVKQTLQVTLLLAVGCWLLYQIKNSHDKGKVYGTNVEEKLSKEEGGVVLGRKGNAGFSDGVERISIRNRVEGGKVEDGGGGDDELDRNVDEKSEEESLHKERVELEEDNQKELDSTQEKSQSQLQKKEEANTETQLRDLDEVVGSDTNQDTRRNFDETALSPSEIEGTDTTDQKEAGNEGGGFQDVNGVPPGLELANATPDEIIRDVGETAGLDQATASSPNDRPGLGENTTLVVVELGKSFEPNGTNDVDMTIDDKVIEREIIQYNDTSETLQDSTSVPSEKEEETVASLKMMLPQGENESQS